MRRPDEALSRRRTQVGGDLAEETLRLNEARLPRTDVARIDEGSTQADTDPGRLIDKPGLLGAPERLRHRPGQLRIAPTSSCHDLSDGSDGIHLNDNVLRFTGSRPDRRKSAKRLEVAGLDVIQDGQFDLDPPKIL